MGAEVCTAFALAPAHSTLGSKPAHVCITVYLSICRRQPSRSLSAVRDVVVRKMSPFTVTRYTRAAQYARMHEAWLEAISIVNAAIPWKDNNDDDFFVDS